MSRELVGAPTGTLLLVVDSEADRAHLQSALRDHRLLFAGSAAEALERITREAPQLLIVDFGLIGSEGDLLRRLSEEHAGVPRVLWAAHTDLQEIVRMRANLLVSRILPKPGQPWAIQRVVDQLLTEVPAEEGAGELPDLESALALLHWTAVRAARLPGSVLRPLPAEARHLQLEFVANRDVRLEFFEKNVFPRWGKPIRRSWAFWRASSPIARLFGRIGREQQIIARRVAGGTADAYLAILPWSRRGEGRATVLVGLRVDEFRPALREALERTHQGITQQLSQFYVPELAAEARERAPAQYLPEYDWVVAKAYVGADRRRAPTSFANPHVMLGRRKYVPASLVGLANTFVDRLEPWVIICFLVYVVLAIIDSVLTWKLVSAGVVVERNPLLRPLLAGSPWVFFAAKNAVAITVFLVVARFQLFRVGRFAVFGAVGGYLLLDLYWFGLLAFRS